MYDYEQFIKECNSLAIGKLKQNESLIVRKLNKPVKFLQIKKENEINGNTFLIEMDVLFDDVHQLPSIYFIIRELGLNY